MAIKTDAIQFYVNGYWKKPHSPYTMSIINPATEETIGLLALGNSIDTEVAIEAAVTANEIKWAAREGKMLLMESLPNE